MKTTSRFALAAAAGLFVGAMAFTPAKAADLGGDCCADLEERVAELEATTARKGNRVVSMQIYGQVNRALQYWDDGVDDDIYSVDNDQSGTRLGVRGTASLKPGWTAGYRIEFDFQEADTFAVSQEEHDATDGVNTAFDMRQAHVYIESDQFGRVTLGHLSQATDGVSQVSLANTLMVPDATYGGSFELRNSNVGVGDTWSDFLIDGDGGRINGVRYDSPSLYGFILSASWGEDDTADIALRFSQEWNSIRFAAAVGYRVDDPDEKSFEDEQPDSDTIAGSASIMHVPSGIFANISASDTETDFNDIFDSTQDHSHISGQIGIERNWSGYGATTVFGEYGEYENSVDTDFFALSVDADTTVWGGGVVQKIDSAAMDVYLHYKHYEVDGDGEFLGEDFDTSADDFDTVVGGARIQF